MPPECLMEILFSLVNTMGYEKLGRGKNSRKLNLWSGGYSAGHFLSPHIIRNQCFPNNMTLSRTSGLHRYVWTVWVRVLRQGG